MGVITKELKEEQVERERGKRVMRNEKEDKGGGKNSRHGSKEEAKKGEGKGLVMKETDIKINKGKKTGEEIYVHKLRHVKERVIGEEIIQSEGYGYKRKR